MAIQAVNQALAVSGQDASHVPFVNASGVIANDPTNFNYASSTNTLTVKNLTLAASGVLTVPATGTLTMNGLAIAQKFPVLSATTAGANLALTAAQSGSLITFDKADGCVVTLPAAAAGLWYEFVVNVDLTNNAYKIVTNTTASEKIVGTLFNTDTDSASAVASWQSLAATGNAAITQSSTGSNATGGLSGTWMRLICASATRWVVTGHLLSGGTVATPFAAS